MNKYGFRIVWSDEDEGYIATSPEFPGLSAFGETQEEALAEAKIAQDLFIADMKERGEESAYSGFPKKNNLTVDAAKINPATSTKRQK